MLRDLLGVNYILEIQTCCCCVVCGLETIGKYNHVECLDFLNTSNSKKSK